MRRFTFATLLVILTLSLTLLAQAGTNSNVATIPMSFSTNESIVTTGTGSFTLSTTGNGLSNTVTLSTTASLIPGNHTQGLIGETYWSSTNALVGVGNNVGSPVVSGQLKVNTGSGAVTCNLTDTFSIAPAGASCGTFTMVPQASLSAPNVVSTPITITSPSPAAFTAIGWVGTFQGTLNFIAFAP